MDKINQFQILILRARKLKELYMYNKHVLSIIVRITNLLYYIGTIYIIYLLLGKKKNTMIGIWAFFTTANHFP